LETIARDTGGRYFGNTNDLDHAIQSALRESSSYYMLGYYPSNKKWGREVSQYQIAGEPAGRGSCGTAADISQ